jgi:hypothetical protein
MPGGITVPGLPHGDAVFDMLLALINGESKAGDEELVAPTKVSGPIEAQAALDTGGF